MESRPGAETDRQELLTRDAARAVLQMARDRMEEVGVTQPYEISTGLTKSRDTGGWLVSIIVQSGYDATEFIEQHFSGVPVDVVEVGPVDAYPESGPASV